MTRHCYLPSVPHPDAPTLVALVDDHGAGALVKITLSEFAAQEPFGLPSEFSGTLLGVLDRDGRPQLQVWCPMWRILVELFAEHIASVVVSTSGDRDQPDRLISALAVLANQAAREAERVQYSARRSATADSKVLQRAQERADLALGMLRSAIEGAPSRKG